MTTPTATDDQLRIALESANIPTLLLVLAYLTGDDYWLADPYHPTRTIALNDNDTGGLPDERQAEIRDAALSVLGEIRDGQRTVPDPPTDERIVDMLSVSLGEQVLPEYAEAMAEPGHPVRDGRVDCDRSQHPENAYPGEGRDPSASVGAANPGVGDLARARRFVDGRDAGDLGTSGSLQQR